MSRQALKRAGVPRLQRQAQVLVDRQALEQVGDLERAREALLADLMRRQARGSRCRAAQRCRCVGREQARDEVEQWWSCRRRWGRSARGSGRRRPRGVALADGADAAEVLVETPSTSSTAPVARLRAQEAGSGRPSWILRRLIAAPSSGRWPPAALQRVPDADQTRSGEKSTKPTKIKAEPQQPVVGPDREQLAKQHEEQRAERRPENAAHAADHHHRQQLARRTATVVDSAADQIGAGTPSSAPARPGDDGRQHERGELVAVGVVALEAWRAARSRGSPCSTWPNGERTTRSST